jgi:hypothetical protein
MTRRDGSSVAGPWALGYSVTVLVLVAAPCDMVFKPGL